MKPTYDREAVNKNIEAIIRFGSCSFDEFGESVTNVFVDLEICKTAPEGIVSFNMPRTKSIARIDTFDTFTDFLLLAYAKANCFTVA